MGSLVRYATLLPLIVSSCGGALDASTAIDAGAAVDEGAGGGFGDDDAAPADDCAPRVLSSEEGWGMHSLAVDSDFVYWAKFTWLSGVGVLASGGIARAPRNGGAAEVLFDKPNYAGLALDASYVYFCDAQSTTTLDRWPRSGPPQPWGSLCAWEPKIDDTAIYGIDERRLVRIDKSTAARTVLADPIGGEIALDDRYVYFTETDLLRVPKAGGAHEHLVRSVPGRTFGWLAASEGIVYAMESYSVAMGGGSGSTFSIYRIGGIDDTTRLAGDFTVTGTVDCLGIAEGFVYFGTDDALLAVSAQGGAPQTVAPGEGCQGIAFDDTHVYWSTGDPDGYRGKLMRACKVASR